MAKCVFHLLNPQISDTLKETPTEQNAFGNVCL